MSPALLGPAFALATALTWSVASLFFKRAGEALHPLPLSIINCAVGLSCMVLLAVVTGVDLTPEVSWRMTLLFAVSGAMGIGVADSLYFLCLNDVGAGRAAIIETAYGPLTVLGAYLYLSERLTMRDVIGAALVVSGIFLVGNEAGEQDAAPVSKLRAMRGVFAGLTACLFFAIAIVAIKAELATYDVSWVAAVRMGGGLVATVIIALFRPSWMRATIAALRPQPAWRFALPAGFFGMFLSMQLWVAGFKYAKASIAAILNQTSTLFIVILAAIFLRERLTPMKVAAVVLGFIGSVLVVL
jgi:drug/metabolite transporter (DMT)-like permease